MGLFKKDKKAMTFDNAMEERRSIYNLKDSISISDDELESMIAHAVKHVPSSFNSQSTRIVLLLNDNNNKFWDNTKAILKEVMERIVISSQLNKKLITSNIHTVQFVL